MHKFKNVETIILGGLYNRETQTNVGAGTVEQVSSFVADVYLMGVCAISADRGITAAVKDDGEVKKAMLRAAKKTVVLANSEKIGSTEHFKICDIVNVHALVTELASNDHRLDDYRNRKLSIF